MQILGGNAAIIRKLIEGISKDICTSAILILRIEAVITIYIRSRVAARNPKTRRNYTKLSRSLPRPHRHSLNLLGILGIGRKIKTTTRQILNIWGDALAIESFREGMVPGIHTVTYTSSDDFIELKHSITNRRALAMGAVLAGEYLSKVEKSGVYSMDDLL